MEAPPIRKGWGLGTRLDQQLNLAFEPCMQICRSGWDKAIMMLWCTLTFLEFATRVKTKRAGLRRTRIVRIMMARMLRKMCPGSLKHTTSPS